MPYPTLNSKSAERLLAAFRDNVECDAAQLELWRPSEDVFRESELGSLRKQLMELQYKFPIDIAKKDKEAWNFEAEASMIVHSTLSPGEFIGDSEFWTWLAAVHFMKLIAWRYGGSNFAPANIGVGAAKENFLFRLWLRAELVLDPNRNDKYELARRQGSIDFWRSHVFRPAYSNARAFARALVEYQYPNSTGKPRLSIGEIRELAKRLTRLRSNLYVAFLSEKEAYTLIEQEAAALAASSP
jgi:hypothetical protein